jgi:hypothetical protein
VPPDDYQIAQLTRDLGKLEGIVHSMTQMIQLEHDLVKEARKEAREQLDASNIRSEQILRGLADQIATLTAASGSNATDHAKRDGALALSRWLFATGLTISVAVAGWYGGKRGAIEAPLCPNSTPQPNGGVIRRL